MSMSSIRLFQSVKLIKRNIYPRYYSLFTNTGLNYRCLRNVNRDHFKSSYVKSVKCFSNCRLMHTSDTDSSSEKSEDNEKIRRILEDEEFQNILQDFAKDFGVDSETSELLEDIRKNVDGNTKDDNVTRNSSCSNNSSSVVLGSGLGQKFKEFSDADSSVIPSYEENYEIFEENEPMYHISQELKPKTSYIDLKRGINGVFDIDELIQVLRNESMLDVTTISIPKELHYADYLVLATAKSERHSEAVSELIRKLHKQKKNKKDPYLKVEGEAAPEWKAMDMGNIVLHIFLEETRNLYDLESLWLLDSTFDSGGNVQPDPVLSVIEEQMAFFNSLQQKDSPDLTKDIS